METKTESPAELQKRHFDIISKNNWKETPESLLLAKRYKEISQEYCLECGAKASITCQYH